LRLPAQSSQELRLSQRCSRHTGNRLPSWKVPGINLLPDFSTETARRIGTQIAAIRRVGDVVIASVHWGGKWGYAIPPSHRAFAHALVDEAGVDPPNRVTRNRCNTRQYMGSYFTFPLGPLRYN
jgi:hypothetical protein